MEKITGTLMDGICDDVWSIIQTYYMAYYDTDKLFVVGKLDIFVIGKLNRKYKGFKLINKRDLNNTKIITMLNKSYEKNKGLLSIDNCTSYYANRDPLDLCNICGDGMDLRVGNYYLQCPARKNNIVMIAKNRIFMNSITNIQSCTHNKTAMMMTGHDDKSVGLFIVEWII